MRKFMVLARMSFRALMSSLSLGSSKGKKMGGTAAVMLLGGLSLYMSGVYSFMFGSILAEANMLRYLLPLMSLLGCVMGVMMTLFAASGFVFSGKDSDLMLSLPISFFQVMLAKLMAVYAQCLLFCGLFLVPAIIAYFVFGGQFSMMFAISAIAGIVFIPTLATILCLLFAFVISYFTSKFPHHHLFGTILLFGFIAVVLVGSFQINSLIARLLQSTAAINAALHSWLLPFGLWMDALEGGVLPLVLFAAICLLPYLALVWVFSTQYKKILSGLASHAVRNDYKLVAQKSSGAFMALYKKEIRRYFNTTIYFFNTGIGVLMLLGFSAYACFSRDKILALSPQFADKGLQIVIFAMLLCLLLCMTNTTCVSISLEGKTLWILKESPVPAKTIFLAKIGVQLLLTVPAVLISAIATGVVYGAEILNMFAVILLGIALTVCLAMFGLCVNLIFPKMEWASETHVVKQSLSAIVGMLGGVVPVGLSFALYSLLAGTLPFTVLCFMGSALWVALAAAMWMWLLKKGSKILIAL